MNLTKGSTLEFCKERKAGQKLETNSATDNKGFLSYLLNEYSQTLLIEGFRLRIRDRELARLFPFSLHNIYRVMIAIANIFYDGFALLDEKLDLSDPQIQETLGTPIRLFRYFHVVLVGAWYQNNSLSDSHFMRLQSLARPVAYRLAAQLTVPESSLNESEFYFNQSSADKRLVITLAVYMREFVDYILMGQHDHSFLSYPPAKISSGVLVLRKFQGLTIPSIPWSEIDFYTCYDSLVYDNLHFDRFRGEIERLPDPMHLHFAAAILPEEKRPLTEAEIKQVLAAIEQELTATKKRLQYLSTVEAEQRLSLMLGTELLALLQRAGQNVELWRNHLLENVIGFQDVIGNRLFGNSLKEICFTDIYIAHLRRATDTIREKIKDG